MSSIWTPSSSWALYESAGDEWNEGYNYYVGYFVTYGGSSYYCIQDDIGQSPGPSSPYWSAVPEWLDCFIVNTADSPNAVPAPCSGTLTSLSVTVGFYGGYGLPTGELSLRVKNTGTNTADGSPTASGAVQVHGFIATEQTTGTLAVTKGEGLRLQFSFSGGVPTPPLSGYVLAHFGIRETSRHHRTRPAPPSCPA